MPCKRGDGDGGRWNLEDAIVSNHNFELSVCDGVGSARTTDSSRPHGGSLLPSDDNRQVVNRQGIVLAAEPQEPANPNNKGMKGT